MNENFKKSLQEVPPTKKELAYGEYMFLKYLLQKVPTGIMSYVADTYDYWFFLSDILPQSKNEIMSRDGKLVVRPDTGNPVDVVCGYEYEDYSNEPSVKSASLKYAYESIEDKEDNFVFKYRGKHYKSSFWVYRNKQNNIVENIYTSEPVEYFLSPEEKGSIELLWETFGGTVNSKGYKVLDSHIGLIYGDGITYKRAKTIFERLEKKGFSSLNVVFGIGSYTIAGSTTRDSLGIAVKATMAITKDGEYIPLFKEPKTDTRKKSAKGFLKVEKDNGKYILKDNVSIDDENKGELDIIFENGKMVKEYSFDDVRNNIWQ